MTKEVKKFLTKTSDSATGQVKFVLGNGLTVEVLSHLLSDEIKLEAMLHGLKQKIGDAASSFSKDANYAGAFSAMQRVADNLASGLWNATGGGDSSDIVQAIAQLRKVDLEDAQAAVDAMDDEVFAKVKAHPQIKAAVAKIKSDRMKKLAEVSEAVSLDELLGG